MSRMLKSAVSLMLVICFVTGMFPAQPLGQAFAAARARAQEADAQADAAAQTLDGLSFSFEEAAALAAARLEGEAPLEEGPWRYVLLKERNFAVIVGHANGGQTHIDIPHVLGGADVVALLSDVFAGHDALMSVTMDGNVYYAAPDALPRGVTVHGYNGSYAQRFAAKNRHAFENLSQLDFVAGVVDCSDVDEAYFTRHSESRVTLRALEAGRLEAGSVFFLADPANLYAISFYQVTSVGEETDGFVTFECVTPEITRVLHSFTLENEKMVADMSTLQLAEGVTLQESDESRVSGSTSGHYGFLLTPEFKLKNGAKIKIEVGYQSNHEVSAHYENLALKTFTITSTETYTIGGAYEDEENLHEYIDEKITSVEDQAKAMIEEAWKKKDKIKQPLKAEQDLCNVTLFSLWGIVSFTLETSAVLEVSGSLELKYTYTTTTEHKYSGGEMKSENVGKDHSGTFKASGEVKVGAKVGLKLYLFVVEFASLNLFAGLKGEAALEYEVKVAQGQKIGEVLAAGLQSVETLNKIDCIAVKVSLLIELEGKLGNKYVEIAGFKMTLLEWQILDLHYHFLPIKFVPAGDKVGVALKTLRDVAHNAKNCPLTDSVYLMIPSIDKEEPMGAQPLHGAQALSKAPVLDLPDYDLRAKAWYEDEKLKKPIETWPYGIRSGERIYGTTVPIGTIELIGYDSKPILDEEKNPVRISLEPGETISTGALKIAGADHIVGYVYVAGVNDLTFTSDFMQGKNVTLTGSGEDRVLLAVRDNDLKITFIDGLGNAIKSIEKGHFISVPQDETPEFPVLYDPAYAVATYEWRDLNGRSYTFPYTFGREFGAEVELYMTPTGIDRVVTPDSTPGSIGGAGGGASGLNTYSDEEDFVYRVENTRVVVTGFRKDRSYVDENGVAHAYTVLPEAIIVPAYIEGLPVKEIGSSAFRDCKALRTITIPSGCNVDQRSFKDSPTKVIRK